MTIAITIFWIIIFVTLALHDFWSRRIPNAIVLPCIAVALVMSGLDAFTPATFYNRLFLPNNSLYSGLLAMIPLAGIFIWLAWMEVGSLGWGDVKLIALIGVVLGIPLIIYWLLASAIASLTGAYVMYRRGYDLKKTLPFGAFLCAGAVIALLLPDSLLRMVFG